MTTNPKTPESEPKAAKAKKLASNVYIGNQWYGPDDDVPADVAKQITNESAWATEGDSES